MIYDLWGQMCLLVNAANLCLFESATLIILPKENSTSRTAKPAHNMTDIITCLHATYWLEGFL